MATTTVGETLSIEEASVLKAFAACPMHDAVTYPHLSDRVRKIADKLVELGLCEVVNNIVRAK